MTDEQRTITINGLPGERRPGESPGRINAILYHRRGVELVPLTAGRAVIIGRAGPADLVIGDPSLSRQHARIELADGEVWIEDLGSKNGTRVAGVRQQQRVTISVGQEVWLGSVILVLLALGGADENQGIESHEAMLKALEREVVRARPGRSSLALIMVRAAVEDFPLPHWLSLVRGSCGEGHLLAHYGSAILQVLMRRASLDAAEATARSMVEAGAAAGVSLLCGLAGYPLSAGSAEELVGACRSALDGASEADRVRLAPARALSQASAAGVQSPAMASVHRLVERLAPSTLPVLIQGETGVGKEVIARALHQEGPRHSAPLRCVNCGAIPDQLVESTLFGHEKGAFTGAHQRHRGCFEQARGGTLLLDEIGELALSAQAVLLRALESGRITPVGASKEVAVDVRIVAATNRDLETMCEEGAFREDLLYRINMMTLQVPPLRDRPEEIPALAGHFLEQARARQPTSVKAIAPDALQLLEAYHWPGNVRELRNVIERAVVIALGEQITVDDLSDRVRGVEVRQGGATLESFRARIQRYEAELIAEALQQSRWNQSEAARLLSMPLRTMVRKIRAYGLSKFGTKG